MLLQNSIWRKSKESSAVIPGNTQSNSRGSGLDFWGSGVADLKIVVSCWFARVKLSKRIAGIREQNELNAITGFYICYNKQGWTINFFFDLWHLLWMRKSTEGSTTGFSTTLKNIHALVFVSSKDDVIWSHFNKGDKIKRRLFEYFDEYSETVFVVKICKRKICNL